MRLTQTVCALGLTSLLCGATKSATRAASEGAQRQAPVTHPVAVSRPILFVVRHQYAPDHHNTATFFPAGPHEYNNGHFTPGAALKTMDFAKDGETQTLLETTEGVIRDPDVHFSGEKILFSMRTNQADSYHLYEIRSDGTDLRQLTFAEGVDDFDPIYLPDESIVFSSTREPKYCMCNRHLMANLYRMEPDGANIHQIGHSTLFEGHTALMPDGRILYDRWEYVDRNFGDAQGLWTVNPDGTAHALYWGNNTASPGAVIDGQIVPGTDQVLCVFGSCHDRPWGALALVNRQRGLEGRAPVVRTWPAEAADLVESSGWEVFDRFMQVRPKHEDPWPLDDQRFLCSRMMGEGESMGLYLLDLSGTEVLLHAEAPGCFDPMPLGSRARPPVIPVRRDFEGGPGYFYVQDVYRGTHLEGVARGTVKALRVVESPEKRFWTGPAWGGQGQQAPAMNWHDFNNKRILGTVPVAEDGSAYFAVPSERFVYFQLLDENGMMIQSMRSGTMVQSGEKAACIGCHEGRYGTPVTADVSRALQREPDPWNGWHGPPRDLNYLTEVQPVFDRHCVRCHDFGTAGGEVLNLAADRDLVFNVSYNELWRKKFISAIGAGPAEIQPAYAWGSHASKLGQTLLKNWKNKLTVEEFDRVVTWIDLNAPYYPTYASAYPDNLAGRSPLNDAQLARLEELTSVPLRQLASHTANRGPEISFDRPELSPCLGQLADPDSAGYREALEIIRQGAVTLAERPRADMPGFEPCPLDQWREEQYQSRRGEESRRRRALREGARVYDVR